jgi:hypothetical protein
MSQFGPCINVWYTNLPPESYCKMEKETREQYPVIGSERSKSREDTTRLLGAKNVFELNVRPSHNGDNFHTGPGALS